MNKVVASEGMVEMQAEVLELLNSVDTKLDYRSFLAATMEKVSMWCSVVDNKCYEHTGAGTCSTFRGVWCNRQV